MIVFIINTETMPYGQVTGASQGKNLFIYLSTVYLTTLRLYRVEWNGDGWTMNWKECGRKRSLLDEVLSHNLPGGTEGLIGRHERPQSGQSVSRTRFEPGTSRIRNRSLTIQPRRSVLSFKLFSVYTRSDSKSINFKRQGFSKHNAGWMIT
jgi:hypothetical protein